MDGQFLHAEGGDFSNVSVTLPISALLLLLPFFFITWSGPFSPMPSFQHDSAASGAVGVAVPKLIPESGSLNDGRQIRTGQNWDNVKLEARITGERVSEGDVPSELDADGEIKQDGVRRTEAITATWDQKTLVMMFMAYVHRCRIGIRLTLLQTLSCSICRAPTVCCSVELEPIHHLGVRATRSHSRSQYCCHNHRRDL